MSAHRTPVIPEIAKAYQNDPRTQLALAAMKAGGSTAPVAQGSYAYMDGIARALQGAIGGYTDRKQQDQYGADEAKKVAAMNAQGASGLAPAAPMAPAAPQAPDEKAMLAQAASALGAPPAPAMAAPPAIPPVPVMTPPVTGGSPQGQRPFGQGSASGVSTGLTPPVPEAVPDAPKVLARPDAPEAVPATRAKTLDAAYKLMATGDRYDYERAQEMLQTGLGDQTRLDESFAERRQRLADMGYQSDLGQYGDSQNQDRRAGYDERSAAQALNAKRADDHTARTFQHGEKVFENEFAAGEKTKDRANAIQLERMRASSALTVAKVREATSEGGSTALTDMERMALSKAVGDKRIDLKGITKFQAKVVAQALVDNPGLDAIALHGYATLAGSPPAQQKAMLLETLPTTLKNYRDAGKELKFSDAKFVGAVQAFAKGQFNDPKFTDYMVQRTDVLMTLAQVMRGTGATDKATAMENDAAAKTMSPTAFDGYYKGQITGILPRVEIAERKGLIPKGTAATLKDELKGGATTLVTTYSDPGKEARYQAWVKANAH